MAGYEPRITDDHRLMKKFWTAHEESFITHLTNMTNTTNKPYNLTDELIRAGWLDPSAVAPAPVVEPVETRLFAVKYDFNGCETHATLWAASLSQAKAIAPTMLGGTRHTVRPIKSEGPAWAYSR